MNVASKELCQELFELSGWKPISTQRNVVGWYFDDDDVPAFGTFIPEGKIPAYGLGYLLRKLPREIGNHIKLQAWGPEEYNNWGASWQRAWKKRLVRAVDKTPENAVCKLCIELFKQGILTNTGKEE